MAGRPYWAACPRGIAGSSTQIRPGPIWSIPESGHLLLVTTIKYTLEDRVPVGEGKLDAHVLKKIGSLGPKSEGHGTILEAVFI